MRTERVILEDRFAVAVDSFEQERLAQPHRPDHVGVVGNGKLDDRVESHDRPDPREGFLHPHPGVTATPQVNQAIVADRLGVLLGGTLEILFLRGFDPVNDGAGLIQEPEL